MTNTNQISSSPLASGPAGSHFEGQVGAFYLLCMIGDAPPRGLPGTKIERIAMQQANFGFELDDVIVHAYDLSGNKVVIEIQVKRSITFTRTDPIFRKVVGQIVRTSRTEGFFASRHELAIATSKGSRKIDGSIQDVLMLARGRDDAQSFMHQINLKGAANEDMRNFVEIFRAHLKEEGEVGDEVVWQLLRRLQILTFDFTASGSASVELAQERVARILHPQDISHVGALWSNLVEQAIFVAKSGGEHTRETLLAVLSANGFRFRGENRHISARLALSDASRLALDDIIIQVGHVVLRRQERISAIHDALDQGRYVEIRGDGGVGKSGVLRQFAEQLASEADVIVLSPGRCVLRGWQAMRAQLNFDGTARDLLIELANDGGSILFIDNLDFFSDEERVTVVDLVRTAADVPGVSIVATARFEFGIDEPSWLPSDILNRLGRAKPIEINDLSEAEIEQLKIQDPKLNSLLSPDHPARQVTRNLFRLARLVAQNNSDNLPSTEIDMAVNWWVTADGTKDNGFRDRARLLKDIAGQSLIRSEFLDVRTQPSQAINTLITSGTLRDLSFDRVAFQHDVFRDWAIANLINGNVELIDSLPLERPIQVRLARGVELAARMAIERANDATAWYRLIGLLSPARAHLSWRRTALFALVRSEAALVILRRVTPELSKNRSALLRELIRSVLAVEFVPASIELSAEGISTDNLPQHFNVPRGPGSQNLIVWLLSYGCEPPAEAIPEIVELYNAYSFGTLGLTPLTPLTAQCLYRWLRLMEPHDVVVQKSKGPVFLQGLNDAEVLSLKYALRSGFVMCSRCVPQLAEEYLTAVAGTKHNEELVRHILKICDPLAAAAPAELAKLTMQALLETRADRKYGNAYGRERPYTFLDNDFLPPSPLHAPFLSLLTQSPVDGLALVHGLVNTAIESLHIPPSGTIPAVILEFPSTQRRFPWPQSYQWSRSCNYYCVTSALMALEAWAHLRIDAGEVFDVVLEDVLGPSDSPACYLLVAIDIIISHWPKSLDVVMPFMACPELLCLDHTRHSSDLLEVHDFVSLRGSRLERHSSVSWAKLKQKTSRKASLESLIGGYVLNASPSQCDALTRMIGNAVIRLGQYGPQADLGNPKFMAQHALNLADIRNWHEIQIAHENGVVKGHQYISPLVEELHFQSLRNESNEADVDFSMQISLCLAVENGTTLSSSQRLAAFHWAKGIEGKESGGDNTMQSLNAEARTIAAMMIMQDDNEIVFAEFGEWAHHFCKDTLKNQDQDFSRQLRGGLRFNPTAIAYLGLIYFFCKSNKIEDLRTVLEVAASGNHAAAHALAYAANDLEQIDYKIPCALLRCAFKACVIPSKTHELSELDELTIETLRRNNVNAIVDAEISWLEGVEAEPQWPVFPLKKLHKRKLYTDLVVENFYDEDGDLNFATNITLHVDCSAAALWLKQFSDSSDLKTRLWLPDIVQKYMSWTFHVNGAGLDLNDELDEVSHNWNNVFFPLISRCIEKLPFEEISTAVLIPITSLPDKHFFDLVPVFLRSIDELYFSNEKNTFIVAVDIRATLATRLIASSGWQYLSGSKKSSVEMHIGPAIASLYFNDYHFSTSGGAYLLPKAIPRLEPFFPCLKILVQAGPSLFSAIQLLNLLEVAPQTEHLELLVVAGKTWLENYANFRPFWFDQAIGQRWCVIVKKIIDEINFEALANNKLGAELDYIVSKLIELGVVEAIPLEEKQNKR
ncbi:ATP-binding protein [Undibacterium umbellatum]|uniref:ATP-binding protein n=1 Tax=Undibacterium umbellatum TaxID=2762300 RepID=A0ABR6ZH12_9BURK|nr:ATP-binding protein [Undibacterium umbellatum]MBC3910959.1 ATP-binding protein [Undibacterium umbellatum]